MKAKRWCAKNLEVGDRWFFKANFLRIDADFKEAIDCIDYRRVYGYNNEDEYWNISFTNPCLSLQDVSKNSCYVDGEPCIIIEAEVLNIYEIPANHWYMDIAFTNPECTDEKYKQRIILGHLSFANIDSILFGVDPTNK